MSQASAAPSEIVIEAGRSGGRYWRDLWTYRELLYFLSWRDVLVRYKQTVIGVAWAVVRPLLGMAVFTVVFGRMAALPSGGVPYAVLVFAGMLPWQFVSTALGDCGSSLLVNSNLVSKVYFPRLIVPASAVAVGLVDAVVSVLMLAGLMAWYGLVPGLAILALPAFAVLGFALALGAGLWLAALNVRYRDVRIVVPFLVQVGLYVSPVGFLSSVVPSRYRLLFELNPMVGIIDGFRFALLGLPLELRSVAFSMAVAALLLATGLRYFRATERSFADVI